MNGASARLAAADILVRCLDEYRTLDDALANSPFFKQLVGPDRGFARAIASAVLRQLGRLDAGLAPFLDRPINTATPPARALLRVGAAQSWLLDTAEHAVVSETVAAAKSWPRAGRSAGFLNAVLRKVVADRSAFDAAPASNVWPDWLWTKVKDDLGEPAASSLLQAQLSPPDIHLSLRDPSRLSEYAETLGARIVAGHSLAVEASDVTRLSGYEAGDWWVQDIAATLPARLLGAIRGDHVLDLCAAPGGKTLQLASLGTKVTALDRSRTRLARLRQNLKRVPVKKSVTIIEADLATWESPRRYDRILLDAPCSALGTLRRHPEGAWIKRQEDVERFPDLQRRLLASALTHLKPGGTLIYCVCSPLSSEGVDIVDEAVHEKQAVRLPIVTGEVPGFGSAITPRGDLLTLPQDAIAHDAFFIARLTRNT